MGAELWSIRDKSTYAYHATFLPEIKVYSPSIKIINEDDANINFSIGAGYLLPMTKGGEGEVDYFAKITLRFI